MLICDFVAVSLVAQRQAHQLLQTHHPQLYGSLLAASAAAAAVSQRAMMRVQRRQSTPTHNDLTPSPPAVKKTPAIWSPAADIESRNNNNNDDDHHDKAGNDDSKWKLLDNDHAHIRCE